MKFKGEAVRGGGGSGGLGEQSGNCVAEKKVALGAVI